MNNRKKKSASVKSSDLTILNILSGFKLGGSESANESTNESTDYSSEEEEFSFLDQLHSDKNASELLDEVKQKRKMEGPEDGGFLKRNTKKLKRELQNEVNLKLQYKELNLKSVPELRDPNNKSVFKPIIPIIESKVINNSQKAAIKPQKQEEVTEKKSVRLSKQDCQGYMDSKLSNFFKRGIHPNENMKDRITEKKFK